MDQRGFAAAEHPGDFKFTAVFVEADAFGVGAPLFGVLDHAVVAVGARGDLRLMRNAQDLPVAAQIFQLVADPVGGFAADVGVDLVEDHHRDRVGVGQHGFQRQHQA